MKAKFLTITAVNAAILAVGSSAWSQTTFDSTVTTAPGMGPDANSSTGYIQTSPTASPANGNVNGGFKVVTAGNLELGLRGKIDHSNTFPDNGNGIYVVPEGTGFTPSRASWNYEFSIATLNGATLGDYTFQLLVDSDPSAADNFVSYNPITDLTDNGGNGTGSTVAPGAGDTLAQNSENALFGIPVGPDGYNPNATGLYDIELIATDKRTGAQTMNEITIEVVPDASATLPLLGSALVGMALIGRKIKAKA